MRKVFRISLVVAVIAVPAAAAVWWCAAPAYQRSRLLSQARKALEADNLDQAKELLRPLLREDDARYQTYFLYAKVLRRLGQGQEARASLRRATQLGLPETEGRREYILLDAVDHFPLAEKPLQELMQEQPNDLEVLQALAAGYARTLRWHEAERAYTRLLEIQPDREDVRLEHGRSLLGAGSFDLAAADFREILRRSPSHFAARLLLSHCLLSNGQVAEAEAELRACRQLDPSHPEPLVGLATCYIERGDFDQAQAFLSQALRADPSSARALHLQGDLYLRRKRYDLAIRIFEQVVRMQPGEPLGHLKLAQALDQSGDRDQAKKHEQQYRQLSAEVREVENRPKQGPQ
jgi:Flp pilus assembly protein TadD